ncbi:MAG: TerB family tellurite resistance protein [Polyangiaceae bacterium]|nr:TerB family tellurite resistance protein [Polyangiaceae bacterium]MCW5792410.1 TerB family tellurite resistance protein [Polyangiaceae bacterium]
MADFDYDDLTEEELLAAIALLKLLAATDGVVTPGEAREMRLFAEQIGPDHYDELNRKLDARDLTADGVKALAAGISRQDARELIFAELFELAAVGTIDQQEGALLEWLRATWKLEPEDAS